ncbi:MAG: S-formylglutathione hydrolase [Pseudomonadales bacterium]
MEQISTNKMFGGEQRRYQHRSETLNCDMQFAVYLPPQVKDGNVPVLYWLSGLTCTDENFVQKAGAQQFAARYGMAIVCPDTSPRGEGVADDAEAAYDFGLGAGFYVNATEAPWSDHYRMYDYVREELPALLSDGLGLDHRRCAISGHSMGGHGALTIALKNPGQFQSVSAFSPICSPMSCPWGEKALGNYIGHNKEAWKEYDAVELISQAKAEDHLPILVDQGDADNFLEEQLNTPMLVAASQDSDYAMRIRMQPGYDHSYFFIASFIEQHMQFHAQNLGVADVEL